MTSLCDLEIPSTIRFSPDAQQVLYSTNLAWNHKKPKQQIRSTLWLAETGKARSSKKITSGQFRDYSPRWAPDGQSIAFISDRADPGAKWAIYGLKIVNGAVDEDVYPIIETDNQQQIAGFEFSPDGKSIAYISADEKTSDQKSCEDEGEDMQVYGEEWSYAQLRIVDLSSKVVRSLTHGKRHITGCSWSRDGDKLAVVSSKSPDIEEPLNTGSAISILTLKDLNLVCVCIFPNMLRDVTWAMDGNIYFISGVPENKVCAGKVVYAVDPSEPQKWKNVGCGVVDDAQRLTVVDGKPVVQVQHGLEDKIYLIPSSSQPLFSKQEQIEAFDVALPSRESSTMVAVATSSINEPVEVWSVSSHDGKQVQLSSHGAAFEDQCFGTCVVLSTKSDDEEVELDSLFLTPSTDSEPPETRMPTIVLIHGGPDARNTDSFNTCYYYWTPYLLRLGYSILLTNYRGSSGKGEAFAAYSTRGIGKWDYEDVITLTNNAIDSAYADPERLIVAGLSQGGFLTYLCSTRNGSRSSWKFAAAVALDGVTSTESMAISSDLGSTVEAELNGGLAPWNVSKHDTRSRQASALWEVSDAVQKSKETGEMVIPPMLIMHGEKDERCPITQAWGMRRALEAHGLPYQFVSYPRQPHLFTERNFWLDLAERMSSWCEHHIGPGIEITNVRN